MRQVGEFCQLRSDGRLGALSPIGPLEIMRVFVPGSLAATWLIYFVRQADGRHRFVREADLEPLSTYTLEELLYPP